MMVDPYTLEVRGEDLAFAASTFDQNGAPAVAFTLTDKGSGQVLCLDHQQRSGRARINDNSASCWTTTCSRRRIFCSRFARKAGSPVASHARKWTVGADLEGGPIARRVDQTTDRRKPDRRDAGQGHDSQRGLARSAFRLILVLISSWSTTASPVSSPASR